MKAAALLPAFALLASPFAVMAQEAAPQEVPAALAGLRFQREEATQWYIKFEGEDQGKWMAWIIGVDPAGARFGNKNHPKPWLAPGDVFFNEGPMAGRFKFIGFDNKQLKSTRTGLVNWGTVAEYEDLKPNKKGWKYESQEGLSEADVVPNFDRTAVFTLKSVGQPEMAEFKLEEFATFALPPDGAEKNFYLKEVSKEKVVVEYKDRAGTVRIITIPKHVKNPAEELEKLSYLRDESVQWYVSFGLESEGQWAPKLEAVGGGKRLAPLRMVTAATMLKAGDTFFEKDLMKGRFKFLGLADKETKNPRTGLMEKARVAAFEDLKPNKKGFKYESIKGLPDAEMASHTYYDRTAVLSLKLAGKEKPVEFKIEELTNFALPPDAPDKTFFLKIVEPEKVVVEYKDPAGAVQIVTIPKRPQDPAAK